MTLFCFGDSWARGAELKEFERPFVHWLSAELGTSYVNYGEDDNSLGMVLNTIVSKSKEITVDDVVIVIVPPDIRWYDEDEENGFYSLTLWQRDDYFKFLKNKTLEWFIYHHVLFIYAIQKILNDIGCRYVMAHNYGQLNPDECKKYDLSIDYSKFLSNESLTNLLSTRRSEWKSYPTHLPSCHRYDEDGPPTHEFSGIYFEGCCDHPNELGHRKISELIFKKLNQFK